MATSIEVSVHIPVLLNEVVEGFVPAKGTELSKARSLSERAEIARGDGANSAPADATEPPRSREASSAGLEKVARPEAKEPTWYLDGTLGGAGHALAVAQAFKGRINVIGLDRHVGENGNTVAGDLHKAVADGQENGFLAFLRNDFACDELCHQWHVLRQNAHLTLGAGERDHVNVVGENLRLRCDNFQFQTTRFGRHQKTSKCGGRLRHRHGSR